MEDQTFNIKQGDLRPYLKVQLVTLSDDGEVEGPQPLTGNEEIVFSMLNKATNTLKIDRGPDVTILDATNAMVQYEWQDGDTDEIGSYIGEFEVLHGGTEPETFPNWRKGFNIKITSQLG